LTSSVVNVNQNEMLAILLHHISARRQDY